MSARVMLSGYDWSEAGEVRCTRMGRTDVTFNMGNSSFFLHMEEATFEKMMKTYADLKIAEARKEQEIEQAQRSVGSSTEIPRGEGDKGLTDAEPSGDPKYRINDYDTTVRAAINGADIDKRCA